jgi:preprotein translocase SecE subunit
MLFLYKPDEGRNARQSAFWLGFGMLAFACFALSGTLNGWVSLRGPLMADFPVVPILGFTLSGAFAIAAGVFLIGSFFLVRYLAAEKQAQHLIEVEGELAKVVWPSFKEASNSSIIVIVTVFVLMGFLALADIILKKFFDIILWGNL